MVELLPSFGDGVREMDLRDRSAGAPDRGTLTHPFSWPTMLLVRLVLSFCFMCLTISMSCSFCLCLCNLLRPVFIPSSSPSVVQDFGTLWGDAFSVPMPRSMLSPPFEVLGSSAIYILPTLLVFHRIWILIRFAHLTWLRFYVCSWRPLPFLSVAP